MQEQGKDSDRDHQTFEPFGEEGINADPIAIFRNKLSEAAPHLLRRAEHLIRDSRMEPDTGKKKHNLALGIYLDLMVKHYVLGIDPFRALSCTVPAVQDDRETIAFEMVAWLAADWLNDHPSSTAANEIAELSLLASKESHLQFLKEICLSATYRCVLAHFE